MASRSFSRALKSPLSRQLISPAVQRRSLASAARIGLAARTQPVVSTSIQQNRGLKTIDFAGTKETVYGKIWASRRIPQS